jgi:Holliday junction resolvase RusA-like endonuclease
MLFARVVGLPGPQGSKSPMGTFRDKQGRTRVRMVESSKKVKPWRTAVTLAMLEANAQLPAPVYFAGAVRLSITFFMPRVQSEPKGWTRHHTKAPDLSKLIRATEDAITDAGIWKDDSHVVEIQAVKVTAEPGDATGCSIVIEALPEKEKPVGKTQTVRAARGSRGPAGAGGRDGEAHLPL